MSDPWKEGIHVQFVNRSAPTPLLMFYVMKHELDYGMMVTASHNPAIYNGIKVFTYGGRDADEIQTKDIENGCWKQKNCIHHVMKRMGRCRRQVIQNW